MKASDEQKRFQTEAKHPPEYQDDLNPDYKEGINYGTVGPEAGFHAPVAYDIKEFHTQFPQLKDDELRCIPVLPTGTALQQGATYLDLKSGEEISARADNEATKDNWFVPKSEIGYDLYNRLQELSAKKP